MSALHNTRDDVLVGIRPDQIPERTVDGKMIVVDLDGVCAEFIEAVVAKFGPPPIGMYKTPKISRWYPEIPDETFWEFTQSISTYQKLKPVPSASSTLKAILSTIGGEILYLTARPKEALEPTKQWLEDNSFPQFDNLVVAPLSENMHQTEKITFLKFQLGIFAVLDDSVEAVEASIGNCTHSCLFDRPWNSRASVGKRMISWSHFFDTLTRSL